jgi:cation transport ATPase
LTNGGELQVTDISVDQEACPLIINKEYLAQIILMVESSSTHPLATALVRSSKNDLTENEDTTQAVITVLTVEEIAGLGIQAKIRFSHRHTQPIDLDIMVGNERLMRAHSCDALSVKEQSELEHWKSQAKSVVLVAFRVTGSNDSYHIKARYGIADTVRPESKSVLDRLRRQGYRVHLLSGDNIRTALAIGGQLNIEPENVMAEVLPEQKGYHIQQLQQQIMRRSRASWLPTWSFLQTKTRAVVMFVGGKLRAVLLESRLATYHLHFIDGLNDSVALSAADVAVAMSHGAQASIASADFVLLRSDLNALVELLRISRKVYR